MAMGRALTRGLAAAVVAAWAKNQATTWIYEHEPKDARRREDAARGDRFAYQVAVQKVADAAGVDLDARRRQQAALALHWALGVGSVLLYVGLRHRWPRLRRGLGTAFGLPFSWLLLDELANPALRLTPPPQRFPWQTHARGAVGHAVLWTTAEGTMRALERGMRTP